MDNVVIVVHIPNTGEKFDIQVPLDITANELAVALSQAFNLGINTEWDMADCYLKAENPIALLKGDKTLREYGVRNGTVINITR